MATERENSIMKGNGLGALSMRTYDIDGNKIRAFFDAAEQLVFVIDDTVTPDKPNALLVINSEDGRKWDDILARDYGVSLEMVRPKKDNKYQKLDIEYVGLDEYDDLISDYDEGFDRGESLKALALFRADASRRAAHERLQAAESAAENARETILRAQTSIAQQQARIKTLRTKLNQQKKSVGREPTKQFAAKILRTESQMDALKDKQHRSQRRLDNARRRLVAAEEDAEIARAILARHAAAEKSYDAGTLPAAAPTHAVAAMRTDAELPAVVTDAPLPVTADTPILKEHLEPKAEEMAEEEVKPLFDKDPEILDEEIAFKPIDFDVNPTVSSAPRQEPRFDDYSDSAPISPLSFVPPTTDFTDVAPQTDAARPAPVLDTITAVEMPTEPIMPQPVTPTPEPAPVANEFTAAERPAPISPAPVGVAAPVAARPISPVTGTPTAAAGGNSDGRKPTFLYYILLIALIVLSVFTLWLYQKKNGDTVPDLAATTAVEQKEAPAPAAEDAPSPFIVAEETVTITETPAEPAPAPVVPVEPEPIPEPEPAAPIVDETIPAVPVVAEPEPAPVPTETPFISEPEPEPEPVKPVVVNKPAYNAGAQNENMFVADADYDTDVVVTSAPAPAPLPATSEYAETVYEQSDIVCDDGTAPSVDGCCGDEVYTSIGGGAYACCSQSSGDCYPPMF